jgi:SAM-dependent methyltransferase
MEEEGVYPVRRPHDTWALGTAYDRFMGRWSRLVADQFLSWLAIPPGVDWLEIGCGTGALTGRILELARPETITACEPASGLLARARKACPDPRATFAAADAATLPHRAWGYGAVVSGLVLNFLPDPVASVRGMASAASPGGTVAAYVWDYADGMEFLRYFWDAAVELDPAAAGADEGRRFPVCQAQALTGVWAKAGLDAIRSHPLEVVTAFPSFHDYWAPFEGGQGPAPTYLLTLASDHRDALRSLVRSRLPTQPEGSIVLKARAWAVAGVVETRRTGHLGRGQ